MSDNSFEDERDKKIAYYKKKLDELSAENIRHDFIVSSLRHVLKQKNDALAVLSILQTKDVLSMTIEEIFIEVCKNILMNSGMDYVLVLMPGQNMSQFYVSHSLGFAEELNDGMFNQAIPISLNTDEKYVLVNRSNELTDANMLASFLPVKYYIMVPVILNESQKAFIVAGRRHEKMPFSPALDKNDADMLIAVTLWINSMIQNRNLLDLKLQKSVVENENRIITDQKLLLEQTLNELKAAQDQLIQKEKMASLGELTAGIAHEIQNPLNFVNNFSEVNEELAEELDEEIKNGNQEAQQSLLNEIRNNNEKISHHGKRADSIVKSMLQHSRTNAGVKEHADLNALADEYLRLAYHGHRAKDKTFNAALETDFDPGANKVHIIPQEIGRVLLNLFNNAFYAVAERKKQQSSYSPMVKVSTRLNGSNVFITVSDNGIGMTDQVKAKIFQPFFTTKPTGQGTGLGMSLSYDIITKRHNGELNVKSNPGMGSEFTITIPV
ncbi:sensor histidine kinase [Pollutibacter soli]|uniref:sensor histidine kinase n=1 Tax=Pollutibacter soli TaxID=3034157 RepID=UPI0030132993